MPLRRFSGRNVGRNSARFVLLIAALLTPPGILAQPPADIDRAAERFVGPWEGSFVSEKNGREGDLVIVIERYQNRNMFVVSIAQQGEGGFDIAELRGDTLVTVPYPPLAYHAMNGGLALTVSGDVLRGTYDTGVDRGMITARRARPPVVGHEPGM